MAAAAASRAQRRAGACGAVCSPACGAGRELPSPQRPNSRRALQPPFGLSGAAWTPQVGEPTRWKEAAGGHEAPHTPRTLPEQARGGHGGRAASRRVRREKRRPSPAAALQLPGRPAWPPHPQTADEPTGALGARPRWTGSGRGGAVGDGPALGEGAMCWDPTKPALPVCFRGFFSSLKELVAPFLGGSSGSFPIGALAF